MNRGKNPFRKFVSDHARLFQAAKKIQSPKLLKSAAKNSAAAPSALIFSPHPDDECIVGALPLRLSREAKWKIVNIAVTLGSKKERRSARLRELKNACDFIGFDLIVADLEKINLETRTKQKAAWNSTVKAVQEILLKQNPQAIFLPHENDVHPTHIGTHFLVLDALKQMPKSFSCFVIETEFWGQMVAPNLLVESKVDDVADLVAALSLHVGEVKRNPYHVRLPAWMMDNVRRGAELIGKRGGSAPDFVLGTNYRIQKWSRGKLFDFSKQGKFLTASANPLTIFK